MIVAPANSVEVRIASAFGDGMPRLERFARLSAIMMALGVAIYVVSVVVKINAPGYQGEAVQIDFAAFWAAARLALAGEPLAAFDIGRLQVAMALPPDTPGGEMLWLYPPGWHMVITPFGLLPFSLAFTVYSALSYLAFALAVRPLAAPLPGGLALMLAGPAIVLILKFGNNSLFSTAALIAALGALGQGRAALAGCFIALLTLKPQLGVLIPVALIAGGYWRVIGWATAGTVAIAAVSTLVMGVAYWGAWFETLRFMSELMQTDLVRFYLMITWYALARFWGIAHEAAFVIQMTFTLVSAAAVAWVWRRPVNFDLKAATLCIAILVAAPYAWHYEMSLALAAAMFLARDGFGATTGARLWLFALWIGQVPGLALEHEVPPAVYSAPLLTATLGLCLWRAARAPEPVPA